MSKIALSSIEVGSRVRKDFGDIGMLAKSISNLGMLHPIVLTPSRILIAGERRLMAAQALGWDTVPVRYLDIESITSGEYAENEVRKDFTPSERVAIGREIERQVGNRQGARTDRLPQNIAEVEAGRETRDLAAERAGFGNRETYRQAKTVIDKGHPDVVAAMDAGELAIRAAAEVAKLPLEDQPQAVHNHRAQGTGENEWYTPAVHIEAARALLGGIDLDPASSRIANETVKAKRFFSIEDDGLAREWGGKVWLNPPYAQPWIMNFMQKMVHEFTAGRVSEAIALTHNYTDTAWFHLAASACSAICFTKGRIGFLSPDGKKAAPTQGQTFIYYGPNAGRFAAAFSQFGLVMVRHGL